MRLPGACLTLTFLWLRTIQGHLRRSWLEECLNESQRIRLQFSHASGLASGHASLSSSGPVMSNELLGSP
jgi:hypothetical protein